MSRAKRSIPSLMAAAHVAFLLNTNCAGRYTLDTPEIERVESIDERGGTDQLRVYISRRLVIYYDEAANTDQVSVGKRIKERSKNRPLKIIISRYAPGKIIAEEERAKSRFLWVSFDGKCTERACAYGFVHDIEADEYLLAAVPEIPKYKPARVYFAEALKYRRLELGMRESLSEANAVYRYATILNKIKTIRLQVRKVRLGTRRNEVLRKTGFD